MTLIAFLIVFSFQGVSTPPSPVTEQAVMQIEQRYNTALLKKDAVAFDELLADDLVHIGFEGQIAEKAEYMSFFKLDVWRYTKYEPSNVKIRSLGNAAVVTGRVDRTIVISGNETTGSFSFTHVWVRSGDRWRLASSQVTNVPKSPAGRG